MCWQIKIILSFLADIDESSRYEGENGTQGYRDQEQEQERDYSWTGTI